MDGFESFVILDAATNIVNVLDDLPASLTAVGSFQSTQWTNNDPATQMAYAGGGLYYLQYTIPTAGAYIGKAVKTGSWDGFGADGRSMDAVNLAFEVQDNNDVVPFILDIASGRVGIFPPIDFILDERSRELYWECHRRTDLIRFGKFTGGSYLWAWKGAVKEGAATDAKFNLYPLSASDVAANLNLTQNAGY